MRWGLAVCVSLVAWALYWPVGWLGGHIWVPIAVTVLALSASALLHRRRARARAAASALEDAIVQQGEKLALRAPHHRLADVQALQRRLLQAMAALKQSRSGKKKGATALYSLPWYMLIGPPGAGKTTALEASGLRFPLAGADGAGVRGVGGTRNCDWWFTDEAILLDTAGRYMTEAGDREEWLAFLQMLRRHRPRCPIDGVVVAISVAELADASEQQIEQHGKEIRARIDEVMSHLQMVIPVYVLFTKADLVAGFVEIFGDMKRSDRRQPWGATLALSADRGSPRALFEAHLEQLVRHVQARSIRRLAVERRQEVCEKIYRFPLELAGIRRNLADLVETIFASNPYQGTPIFRGFYFTSGTQEGRPLERLLQRMGQVMGIHPAEPREQEVRQAKSYFLHDVFMNVVFKDAGIAALSACEIRRRSRVRLAAAAAAAAIAVTASAMAAVSFTRNCEMLHIGKERVEEAQKIDWDRSPSDSLDRLDPMLGDLRELDVHREEGVPLGMGWMMYQGERLQELTTRSYIAHLQRGFVAPCRDRLEERLRAVKGDRYLAEHRALKAYLMLDDSEHGFENVDIEWATGQYTDLWLEILKASADSPEAELRRRLARHVRYYFTLVAERRVAPVPLDRSLIARVREVLMSVPVARRYDDQYVHSVAEEKLDAAGSDARTNLRHPGVILPDLFSDRPDALAVLMSATFEKDGKWRRVEGPYTASGHDAVLRNLILGKGLLEREAWVVPLGPEETPERIVANVHALANDYERRYAEAWMGFLADVMVRAPVTLREAVALYGTLAAPPRPYLQILRALEDHTTWPIARRRPDPEWEKKALALAEKRLSEKVGRSTGGLLLDFDVLRMGDHPAVIPAQFAKTVGFGVPVSPGDSVAPPLARYISRLDALRTQMERVLDADPRATPDILAVQLADAAMEAEALVALHLAAAPDPTYRDPARLLLRWLWCPLRVGEVRLPAPRRAPFVIECRCPGDAGPLRPAAVTSWSSPPRGSR